MTDRKEKLAVLADYAEELGLADGETVLWMVEGTEGQYSDRREWPVALYFTEEQAKAHVAAAEAAEIRLREAWLAEDPTRESWEWRGFDLPLPDDERWTNPFDTRLKAGSLSNSVTWFVYSVPLRKALPLTDTTASPGTR